MTTLPSQGNWQARSLQRQIVDECISTISKFGEGSSPIQGARKFRGYDIAGNENKLRRTIKNFNRSFRFVNTSVNGLLEDITLKQAEENLGQYLSLVDTFGERNMSKEAMQTLIDTLSNGVELENRIRANDPVVQLTT